MTKGPLTHIPWLNSLQCLEDILEFLYLHGTFHRSSVAGGCCKGLLWL